MQCGRLGKFTNAAAVFAKAGALPFGGASAPAWRAKEMTRFAIYIVCSEVGGDCTCLGTPATARVAILK